MNSKTIIIVGSGRSGTSFMSNLFHYNNVYAGNCVGGTLENVEARKINESYLEEYCQAKTRSEIPYGILPPYEININKEYKDKSLDVIKKIKYEAKTNGSEYCVIKDPRTTLLHDMWIEHADYVVGIFRNPVEVVESYMKLLSVYYDDNTIEYGYVTMLNYWKRYNQSLLFIFEHYPHIKKFMVDFNGNIKEQITGLFKNMNLELNHFNYDENKKHNNSEMIYDDETVIRLFDNLKEKRNL